MTARIRGAIAATIFALAALPATAQSSIAGFSGFYWGAAVGWGQADFSGSLGGSDLRTDSLSPSGFAAGLLTGVGWQRGRSLWGLEADFTKTFWAASLGNAAGTTRISADIEWMATLRARLGWIANDKWLLFGSAGLSYADASWTATNIGGSSQKIGLDAQGWVVSFGAERSLNRAWNGRIEAFYYGFDRRANTSTLSSSSTQGDFASLDDAWALRIAFTRAW